MIDIDETAITPHTPFKIKEFGNEHIRLRIPFDFNGAKYLFVVDKQGNELQLKEIEHDLAKAQNCICGNNKDSVCRRLTNHRNRVAIWPLLYNESTRKEFVKKGITEELRLKTLVKLGLD